MDKSAHITDAEWLIMRALWDQGSATTAEITAAVKRERDVSTQTVKTLLRRLIDKDLVGFTVDADDSRIYHYQPRIEKTDAVRQKSDAFLSTVYQSNVGEFITSFVENSGLSKEELLQLRKIVTKKLHQQS
ncbi:MAG: BlaI/MecI/CopY family transcriptional regulator [Planctomycetes bacterium]|nr:BlaI/MecI/CopY family transcriptional regulator [Planctomycetota bacterium]